MISSVSVKYSYYKYVLWTLYIPISGGMSTQNLIFGYRRNQSQKWFELKASWTRPFIIHCQIFACDDFPNFRSAFSSILHFKKSIKCGKNEEKPYGTCIQDIQFRVLHLPPLFSTYLPSKKEPAGFFFNSTYVRKVKLRHFLQKNSSSIFNHFDLLWFWFINIEYNKILLKFYYMTINQLLLLN